MDPLDNVRKFQRDRLISSPWKNWNLFYRRCGDRFFKDRKWIDQEFHELVNAPAGTKILEAGCGVGNTIFPLIKTNPDVFMYACDYSECAIEIIRKNPMFDPNKLQIFVCDLVNESLIQHIKPSSVDITLLIFCLSANRQDDMRKIIQNCVEVTSPGGLVIVRDYAVGDQAQKRFKPSSQLGENLYLRQDGTLANFMTTESIKDLFSEDGLLIEENKYVSRSTINHLTDATIDHLFIQAKIRKFSKAIKQAGHSLSQITANSYLQEYSNLTQQPHILAQTR